MGKAGGFKAGDDKRFEKAVSRALFLAVIVLDKGDGVDLVKLFREVAGRNVSFEGERKRLVKREHVIAALARLTLSGLLTFVRVDKDAPIIVFKGPLWEKGGGYS